MVYIQLIPHPWLAFNHLHGDGVLDEYEALHDGGAQKSPSLLIDSWKQHTEGGTFARLSHGRDVSIVVVHYFFGNREAYAGSGILRLSMEPLKHVENFLGIFLVEPYPVIRDLYEVIMIIPFVCGQVESGIGADNFH